MCSVAHRVLQTDSFIRYSKPVGFVVALITARVIVAGERIPPVRETASSTFARIADGSLKNLK